MYEVFGSMKKYSGKRVEQDIETLVMEYKGTKDKRKKSKSYAAIYCKLFPIVLKVAKKYITLTIAQKAETSMVCLYWVLESYKGEKYSKFNSYFHFCFNNHLQTILSKECCLKRKVWMNMISTETAEDTETIIENRLGSNSMTSSIEQLTNDIMNSAILNSIEKRYCLSMMEGYKPKDMIDNLDLMDKKFVLKNNIYATDTIVRAKSLNTQIRRSIKQKLIDNGMTF